MDVPRLLQIEAAHLLPVGGGGAVTVSMRVMSAGDGYRYLLRTVAAGDGERSLATPLARYYTVKGTPPGRWVGSGLPGLAAGTVVEGDEVTEEQLQLLIGMGRDPVSGEPLGRAYPAYQSFPNRSAAGDAASHPHTGRPEQATARTPTEFEAIPHRRRAVAGYDFTFSIPKSASVLWGLSDAATQARIMSAHHEAVADAVRFLEREVAATRTGECGSDGAVAQVDVAGLIATAFDHFDSRAGDPHLHTHVVISNKVQTVLDGKWRSLDGRPMHAAVVAVSELHEALFADTLTRALGVQWEVRERGRDRHPAWAIRSVPEPLVVEFSTRSRHIDVETDRLIHKYSREHGHRPSPVTITKLRAQATMSTRPAKELHSLAELTAGWRERAEAVLGPNATKFAGLTTGNASPAVLKAEQVPPEMINALGMAVMATVSQKRATWRHWNLAAEAARQTMQYRFPSASDREAVIGLIVNASERASVQITPPELAPSPPAFRRDDGTSVFRPKHSIVFTSAELLDAESRLLERAADRTAPRVASATMRSAARVRLPGGGVLADEQATALANIVSSGRAIDVLVGPAGAGKTTAMNALRGVWETAHGAGSVVGLAPSAAAAQALAGDLGISTENLSKWWQNYMAGRAKFRAGQLLIIDEASLASTLDLDRITEVTTNVRAKVLLVGDYAQLQSVDAGGAFSLLVHDRSDAPELVDVRRFVHEWEKPASLGLRHGNAEAIDVYVAHNRVRGGSSEAMANAAFQEWRKDALAGKSTLLISDSIDAVTTLNDRARTELILEGRIDATREVTLNNRARVAVGDTIITRRNARQLHAGRTWVRNGDRWVVTTVGRGGSLEVRRQGRRWGNTVVLPADYVKQNVELGYAVTSYRAQGITTDTAHVVVASGTTRENLYVAMTRGRESNTAYVAVDRPDAAHLGPRPGDDPAVTAISVLFGVLQHVGAERSAHETIAAEQEAWGTIAQLAAEYDTIAAAGQHERWVSLVRGSGLTNNQVEAVLSSDAFGPLTAELRRAEAYRFDVAGLLPRLVAARGFQDAQDVAAVLRDRVEAAIMQGWKQSRPSRAPQLIAGLVPRAMGPMVPEVDQALAERRHLIEARARAVLDRALLEGEPWTRALGSPPRDGASADWRRHACTVAAYRDRYGLIGPHPLGPPPETMVQGLDATRARASLKAAEQIANYRQEQDPRLPIAPMGVSRASIQF